MSDLRGLLADPHPSLRKVIPGFTLVLAIASAWTSTAGKVFSSQTVQMQHMSFMRCIALESIAVVIVCENCMWQSQLKEVITSPLWNVSWLEKALFTWGGGRLRWSSMQFGTRLKANKTSSSNASKCVYEVHKDPEISTVCFWLFSPQNKMKYVICPCPTEQERTDLTGLIDRMTPKHLQTTVGK